MTSVSLQVPREIIEDLDLPYDGVRDGSAVRVVIDGLNVAAALITLATLRTQASAIAAAIRRWRLRDPRASVAMVVKGPGLDLKLDLPRNVSRAQILAQLQPLLDEE